MEPRINVKEAIDYLAKGIAAGEITDPETIKALAALIESTSSLIYYDDED